MAAKKKTSRQVDKRTAKGRKQGLGAKIAGLGSGLKVFFINLRTEMKRVQWPDRKKLIHSTGTVLAICIAAGLLLFLVDTISGGILEGIGFYS